MRNRPIRIEVLSFDCCPNDLPVAATVDRLLDELALQAEIRRVHVPDLDAAQHLRFLGSPTIRINGRDIEPGADKRTDYGLGCRLFPTESGLCGQPQEGWIREALIRAAGS